MAQVLVLYNTPAEPAAFDRYYHEKHIPLARKIPGLRRLDGAGGFAGFNGAAADISDRRRPYFKPDEEALRIVFTLTERERQVLVLVAEGKSTRRAARQLGISYKTVESHRSRILEKLGVHEPASMVRYAIRAGLIAP